MGRRKKNAPVRKHDSFMSICKISVSRLKQKTDIIT